MLVGILFKVSAAPFHVWTPDVYEGAPTPVAALLATAPKAAAFALLLRVLYQMLPAQRPLWSPMLWVVAVLSMTVGNLAALRQRHLGDQERARDLGCGQAAERAQREGHAGLQRGA